MAAADEGPRIFLDDDPKAIEAADLAEAQIRRGLITPHQAAILTIEFKGMAELLIAKGIAVGQTRVGFLTSMASLWDEYFRAYQVLRRSQSLRAEPAPATNEAGPAAAAPPAVGSWERRPDGTETLRTPPRCGKDVGVSGWSCSLAPGHKEPCTP